MVVCKLLGGVAKAQASCFVAASVHTGMHAHAGAAALLRSHSAVARPKPHCCRLPLPITAACPLLRTKLIRMHGKRPKDTGVALALYDEMRQDGIAPDAVCFNTCLTAAGKRGRGECGVQSRPRQQAGGAAARLCSAALGCFWAQPTNCWLCHPQHTTADKQGGCCLLRLDCM